VTSAPESWSREHNRRRTADLTGTVLSIWSKPKAETDTTQPASPPELLTTDDGFEDTLGEDGPGSDASWIAGAEGGKYQPLTQWLSAQTLESIPISFETIEDILGASLAPSARNHPPYWYSTSNSLGKAITAGGFKATGVNLTAERVVLVRR
jgi:hypothetical protein